jgi:hypothetical protein
MVHIFVLTAHMYPWRICSIWRARTASRTSLGPTPPPPAMALLQTSALSVLAAFASFAEVTTAAASNTLNLNFEVCVPRWPRRRTIVVEPTAGRAEREPCVGLVQIRG